MIWHPGSDENENPFDCMIDAEDYADMDQVCGTTLFWKKKKSLHHWNRTSEQDINMETELKHRTQEAYQYANALVTVKSRYM